MANWLRDTLSTPMERLARRAGASPKERPIVWLDEVFANRELKPKGNLQNFGKFVTGLAARLDTKWVAYRTIEPRMLTAAERDFGCNATILERQRQVPDRRDLIVIRAQQPVKVDWGMA